MPDTYIGLMSGTSLDGIDAVVARFGEGDAAMLVHSHYQPFQPQLRDALLALNEPGHDELHRAALCANQLAHAYAAAIRTLLAQAGLDARDITAIGCHGQTVRHRPDAGYTTQLINGALLAELSGMDEWITANLDRAYDDNGAWAATGVVIPKLLNALLAHEFFARRPPKSTGRDLFNLAWVRRALSGDEAAADVQATLLALTADGIAHGVESYCPGAQSVFVCGGGAHNDALMARLSFLMPNLRVATTSTIGVGADWVEALAFAWLARQITLRLPGNVPGVTGAQGPRVLGAIYPA